MFNVKNVILFVSFIGCLSLTKAGWIRSYSDACLPSATSDIKQLSDGGFIVGGYSQNFSDFGLIRLDSEGEILWQRTYGGNGNERYISEIEILPDGGFAFAGGTASFWSTSQHEGWVFRTNADGTIQWQKRIGSEHTSGTKMSDEFRSIKYNQNGFFWISGKIGWSSFPNNSWILKLDELGNILFEKSFDGGSDISRITQLSNGQIVLHSNNYLRLLDQNSNIIWAKTFSTQYIETVRETHDGNLLILAFIGGYSESHIVKIDIQGNIIWQKKFDNSPQVEDLQIDDDGFILVGNSQSNVSPEERDALILKANNNGEIIWQKFYDGGGYDDALSGTHTNDGGYIVAAYARELETSIYRLVIIRLDENGNIGGECSQLSNANYLLLPGVLTSEFINNSYENVQSEIQNTNINGILTFPSEIYYECEGAQIDQDNDGVADVNDNCPTIFNPNQTDQDNDGIGDLCDDDIDGDGILNSNDNCENIYNPDQLDIDGDGIGDVCDTDTDTDGDLIPDQSDNCPNNYNPDQADNDNDQLGDLCDPDDDNDLVIDIEDNCPQVYNPLQEDNDLDGEGDVCDGDLDNDGVANEYDQCPNSPVGALINSDGCTGYQLIDLICPCENDYKNHGQFVRCVSHASRDALNGGLITEKERAIIISNAAQSDCGK